MWSAASRQTPWKVSAGSCRLSAGPLAGWLAALPAPSVVIQRAHYADKQCVRLRRGLARGAPAGAHFLRSLRSRPPPSRPGCVCGWLAVFFHMCPIISFTRAAGVWQVQEDGLRVLQGHEVDAALTADNRDDLRAVFKRLLTSGAAWLNESYAILHVDPRSGMLFGYRYRSDPNPAFAAATSSFSANQVKRLLGVAATARPVGPGARVLVLRFTESDDTSFTEAWVFPDPESSDPGALVMLLNRLEGECAGSQWLGAQLAT